MAMDGLKKLETWVGSLIDHLGSCDNLNKPSSNRI